MPKVLGRRRRVIHRLTRDLMISSDSKARVLEILTNYNAPCDEEAVAKIYSICKEGFTELMHQWDEERKALASIYPAYDLKYYLTNQCFDYYSDYTYWFSLDLVDSSGLPRIPRRRYSVGTNPEEFMQNESAYYDSNDSLHPALQDLADQIAWRISDIMNALWSKEDAYYPLPENIPPVSDEHVELVCMALERELMRETRLSRDGSYHRPHLPLSKLPANIKRAVAEWRRAEYYAWGITNEVWHTGKWSILHVPDDLWEPPVLRNMQPW
jgi:hypothetical protein